MTRRARCTSYSAIDPWFLRQHRRSWSQRGEGAARRTRLDSSRTTHAARGEGARASRTRTLAQLLGRPRPRCARAGTARASARSTSGWTPAPPSSRRYTPYLYSHLRGARTRRRRRTARRCSSWAAGPSASARASSSTTAACTPSFALREAGYETVMVNCNPETVSTDYDTSDRLYFEPLTIEDVLEIAAAREARSGAIVQFGGQTPLRLSVRAGEGRAAHPRHRRRTPSTAPRIASASPQLIEKLELQAAGERRRAQPRGGARGRRAHRLPGDGAALATCSAAGRWRSVYDARQPASATCARR